MILFLILSCDAVHNERMCFVSNVGKPWSTENLAQTVKEYTLYIFIEHLIILMFSIRVFSQTLWCQGKAQVLYSCDWSVGSYLYKLHFYSRRLLGPPKTPHHLCFGPRRLHWQKRHLDHHSISLPFQPSTLVILSFLGRIIGCKGGAQQLHQHIFTPPMPGFIQTYSVSVLLIMCSLMVCLGIYREGIAQQVSNLPFILA